MSSPTHQNDPRDNVRREKTTSVAGNLTFVGLRALEPVVEYGILSGFLIRPLIRAFPQAFLAQLTISQTGISVLDNLGLSPYRLIVLLMTAAIPIKQGYWKLAIGEQYMPASDAAKVSIFNTIITSFTVLPLVLKYTSPAARSGESLASSGFPPLNLTIGAAMLVSGLLAEGVAEQQRANFKKLESNKGKVYTGGLFSLARHINYGAYTVWRFGLALATGGLPLAVIIGGFFAWDFVARGIPVLDKYCADRYGEQWTRYKKLTPYQMLPGVF